MIQACPHIDGTVKIVFPERQGRTWLLTLRTVKILYVVQLAERIVEHLSPLFDR